MKKQTLKPVQGEHFKFMILIKGDLSVINEDGDLHIHMS